MIAFIIKYWLEILFGLIATGASFVAKKFYSLYKKEQQHIKEDEEASLKNTINQEVFSMMNNYQENSQQRYDDLQTKINSLETELSILKNGILCIQGKGFKTDCRKLLDINHSISQEEWDLISSEHTVYNSLGGNHDGDRLYEDVKIKYHNNLE